MAGSIRNSEEFRLSADAAALFISPDKSIDVFAIDYFRGFNGSGVSCRYQIGIYQKRRNQSLFRQFVFKGPERRQEFCVSCRIFLELELIEELSRELIRVNRVRLDKRLTGIKWIYSDSASGSERNRVPCQRYFLLIQPVYPLRSRLIKTDNGTEPLLSNK